MKRRKFVALSLAFCLALGMSACTKSAPEELPAPPTQEEVQTRVQQTPAPAEESPLPAPVETLLVTTTVYSNGENDNDGIDLIVYTYDPETQTLAPIFRKEHYIGTYPANTLDFENQILYYAAAKPNEPYDNLYAYDLRTGAEQQLTDGKNFFNDLLFVDGVLYANVAREFCNCCQPARFDFEAHNFIYRDETDDDTEHTSFSYDPYADSFLILTDRLSETRTHRVCAETHIEPKTISLLSKDFQTVTKLFFTEDFQVYLTRRLGENSILMSTESQMVAEPRTLKRLDIDTQEVEDVVIPGIRQIHMFYPSSDENTLYFTGQFESGTTWNLYRYELDMQKLTQIAFPEQPRQIVDFQITRHPCESDCS